jgi:hypothetical protein
MISWTQEMLNQTQSDMLADPNWHNEAGCKSCAGLVRIGDWYECEGDHYGKCCVSSLKAVGGKVSKVAAGDPTTVDRLRRESRTAVPELLFKVRLTNGWALMVHAIGSDVAEPAAKRWITEHCVAGVAIDGIWMGKPEEVTERGLLLRA